MTPPSSGRGPTVELRDYIERIMEEREKAQAATFAAALREADSKSRELERRLEGLNELRSEVTTDRLRYVEKSEFKIMHEALSARVSGTETIYSRIIGIGIATVLFSGIISALIAMFVK